jgi:hypothetical protein
MRGRWDAEQVLASDAAEILKMALNDFTLRHVSRLMGYSRHSPGIHHLLTDRQARVPLWRLDLLLRALDGYMGHDLVVEASPSFGG